MANYQSSMNVLHCNNNKKYSTIEIVVALVCYFYFVPRCFYLVYQASEEKKEMLSFDLHPSWWFGRKIDDSDYEWRFWIDFYSNNMKWYLGHALMGFLINNHFQQGRIYFNIAYSVVALSSICTLKQLSFIVSNTCIVYLSVVLFKSKIIVWILNLLMLGFLNLKAGQNFVMDLCYPDPNGYKYMFIIITMTVNSMRLISFGVDMCEAYSKSGKIGAFHKALCYSLYFPFFSSGPFVSYQRFISNISLKIAPPDWCKVKWFIIQSLRLQVWWLIMEISLHYFYSTALQQEEYFLLSASKWMIFALCLVQAILFNIKYVVLYGVSSLFSELDGVKMPASPVCLIIQHKASHIWQNFDPGLYKFIRRYVYIPLGGSRHGLSQQMLTSFLCFIFIGFWHGAEVHLFIWVLVNYLCNVIENLHAYLLTTPQWKSIENEFGEDAAFRIQTMLMTPIGILSLWSMFLFLGGQNVAFNMYKRILWNSDAETRAGIMVLAYMHIVASTTLTLWSAWLSQHRQSSANTNSSKKTKVK